jgi:hypothetical protein
MFYRADIERSLPLASCVPPKTQDLIPKRDERSDPSLAIQNRKRASYPKNSDKYRQCGLICSFGARPLDEKAITVEFLKRKSVQQEAKFCDLAVLKAYIRQAKRLEGMWVVFNGDYPGLASARSHCRRGGGVRIPTSHIPCIRCLTVAVTRLDET